MKVRMLLLPTWLTQQFDSVQQHGMEEAKDVLADVHPGALGDADQGLKDPGQLLLAAALVALCCEVGLVHCRVETLPCRL